MEPVIKVEHLAKMYQIQAEKGASYSTLRDTIAGGIKNIFAEKNSSGAKKEFWALDDVNFEINQGDRVGIIGRNGAGKSTLLKILSRIVSPTKGKITIEGKVGSLLEVGTGFHPELTGRENVFLNGSLLGMGKEEIKKKFDEIVAFAEVEKFLDTPVKRYSSGMYVRLAFAVAAHLEPEILIVDEVLAVGDAAFQRRCLGKMEDVSSQGRTILFVSHSMDVVQKLCNRGILLGAGKVIEQGPMSKVIARYLDSVSTSTLAFDIPAPANANEASATATKVEVLDENGNSTPEIILGKNYSIVVDFEVKKFTAGFVIASGINTVFGQAIRTTWSKPKDLQPGKYKAVFKNDGLVLTSAQYKITVGLSAEKKVIQYAENCGLLIVSDVSTVFDDDQIINTKSGIIINQMEVEIKQL